MTMRIRRNHLGIGFEIWTDQWTWFWSLSNPRDRAGVVGATASGTDAIEQAHLAIEELLQRSGVGWTRRLNRNAEYLARIPRQFAAI